MGSMRAPTCMRNISAEVIDGKPPAGALAEAESRTTGDWIFEDESGRFVYQPKGSIRTNDAEQMRIAVLSHLGIANAPTWLFAKEFASGDVCPLLIKFAQPTKPIFALRPSGRRLAAKVHVFVDFMQEILARELSTAVTKSAQLHVK